MLTVLLLAACSGDFEDHPTIREGDAELDPNTPPPPRSQGLLGSGSGDAEDPEPGDTGEIEEDPEEPVVDEVCYPGAAEDWTACVELVPYSASWGEDYTYPAPYNGSAQYSEPARFIDLASADPTLMLAPNFTLDEVMQEHKGRYALYQTHVMEYLQVIRDTTGAALYINSGYRNVSYNAGVGGATYSRHMYGDAVDMYSGVASLSELADICESLGAGYVSEYTSHVHCDWRDDTLDDAFFDAYRSAARAPLPRHAATITVDGDVFTAPAVGFDEGEPRRVWTATDADGAVLEVFEGTSYVPPDGAAALAVRVGRQVEVDLSLD